MPGGKSAEGISGLIDYIAKHRREDFERTLCRKFLGYALGRSVVLSDEPLLQEMQKNLRAERRFSVLFETVVLSRNSAANVAGILWRRLHKWMNI